MRDIDVGGAAMSEDATAPLLSRHKAELLTVVYERRLLPARILGAGIRLLASLRRKCQFASFGSGSSIQRPCFLVGAGRIRIGRRVAIWRGARLEALATRESGNAEIEIGDDTTIQPFAHIGAVKSVKIGKNVLIASNVYVADHDHSIMQLAEMDSARLQVIAAPVVIGDGTWLGEGVKILKGVRIGDGCIVGAGSVVTRDIPPGSVAAGVPARVIRGAL